MNKITRILTFLLVLASIQLQAQVRVIIIGAHPDDCDNDAGGTAALFVKMGHAVKFVSVTNGDAGHETMDRADLAKVRATEAQNAGKILGVEYTVLNNHDGELEPTLEVRLQIIREIRKWNADIVIAPRPNDYHPDHRYTGILVQDAAYMVGVPHVASDTPPLRKNPVFLYTEDGFDKPNPFVPDISVDITDVYQQKINALAAHKSQFFDWLPWIGGYTDQVPKSDEDRITWLAKIRKQPITKDERTNLEKWYGKDKSVFITDAESFEICEYGWQPTDEDIRALFPMLTTDN